MPSFGVKFRAYPTIEQANILSQWIGCSRVIYNCKVTEDNKNYSIFKSMGKNPYFIRLIHILTMKKEIG